MNRHISRVIQLVRQGDTHLLPATWGENRHSAVTRREATTNAAEKHSVRAAPPSEAEPSLRAEAHFTLANQPARSPTVLTTTNDTAGAFRPNAEKRVRSAVEVAAELVQTRSRVKNSEDGSTEQAAAKASLLLLETIMDLRKSSEAEQKAAAATAGVPKELLERFEGKKIGGLIERLRKIKPPKLESCSLYLKLPDQGVEQSPWIWNMPPRERRPNQNTSRLLEKAVSLRDRGDEFLTRIFADAKVSPSRIWTCHSHHRPLPSWPVAMQPTRPSPRRPQQRRSARCLQASPAQVPPPPLRKAMGVERTSRQWPR